MRWQIAGLVVIVCLTVIYVQASAASPRYALTQLRAISTAAGMYANAYDINDAGVVAGSESRLVQTTPTGTPRVEWANTKPLTWSDGSSSATALPTIAGYGSEAYAINNAGIAVGTSASTTGNSPATHATVFRAGVAGLIPRQPASNGSLAVDINDAGVAVGTDSAIPFAYNALTNSALSLNRGNSYWQPQAINEAGTIVANGGSSSNFDARPARLSGGAAPAFLYAGTNRGTARDLNEAGVAVGQYDTGNFNFRPAIFNNGSVQTLTVAGIASGDAAAINDRGRVVGWTRTTLGVVDAFVYENGTLLSLTSLVDALPARMRLTPNSINNRGQIVGQTAHDDDNNASTPMVLGAFRLDPIRSPGDTNYDDVVDFTDLLTLAQNYGRSGNGNVFWETGDFDFDWNVNFDDLLTLAQHYNAPAAFASDWALARTLVPEPFSAFAAGSFALVCRRRR